MKTCLMQAAVIATRATYLLGVSVTATRTTVPMDDGTRVAARGRTDCHREQTHRDELKRKMERLITWL